jgi:hypothetical protein
LSAVVQISITSGKEDGMRTAIACFALVVLVSKSLASVYVVSPDGTGDFLRIQAAIEHAAPGDEILVRPGTYQESLNFLGKDLLVHSSDGADVTVIRGDQGTPGHGSCLELRSGESRDAILEGFTLAAGHGTWSDLTGSWLGGAVYCENAGCSIRSCLIHQNVSDNGGAMFLEHADVSLTDTEFLGNTAHTYGGAISGIYSVLDASGCSFKGNTAEQNDGAVSLGTGVVATLEDCLFRDNHAQAGAGLNIGSATVACTVRRCTFRQNRAESLHGGGVRIHESSPLIQDCLFVGNEAALDGGGLMEMDGGSATIRNCTFAGNAAERFGGNIALYTTAAPVVSRCIIVEAVSGGGVFADYADAAFSCCDTWNNAGGDYVGLTDPTGSDGNISLDPIFCDAEAGDYTIRQDSPCAPYSPPNPQCALIGALPVGCVAAGAPSASSGPKLLLSCPNPFRPPASLWYTSPTGDDPLLLQIHDAGGRLVRVLVRGLVPAGSHKVIWDGRDDDGRSLPNGVYFYSLRHGSDVIRGSAVLFR